MVVSLPVLITATGGELDRPIPATSTAPSPSTSLITEAMTLPVPNGLSPEHAALTEPLAVGEHAVAMGDPGPEHVFMVVGCGPVGLAVIASLKARGLGPVIAADYSAERRAAAERMGADRIVDPAADLPARLVGRATACPATRAEGLIAEAMGKEVKRPLIFECVGAPGMIAVAGRGRAGRHAHRGGRRLHGDATTSSRWCSSPRRSSCASCSATPATSSPGRWKTSPRAAPATTRSSPAWSASKQTPDAFVRLQTDKSQIKILVAPGR